MLISMMENLIQMPVSWLLKITCQNTSSIYQRGNKKAVSVVCESSHCVHDLLPRCLMSRQRISSFKVRGGNTGAAKTGEHKQVFPISALDSSCWYLFPGLNSVKRAKCIFGFARYQ